MEHKEHAEHTEAETSSVEIETHGPVEISTEAKKDRFLPLSILIAAIVIGGSIVFATLYHPAAAPAAANNPAAGTTGTTGSGATLSAAQINTLGSRDAVLGNPNAPVTLIEYGDYQCPFCGRYFQTIEPEIMQQYISPGKVKMVFRNFAFLGAESTAAAEAAECAEDQNQLWAYHDALYQAKVNDVAKGGSEDDGFFTQALFITLAEQTHLDIPTFTACVQNNKDSNLVSQDNQSAAQAGVNSTPTTFVNGKEVTESDGSSAGADSTAVLNAIAAALAAK